MVFAQSGFGKTNLVKVLLFHMVKDTSYGKLVFDLNGEYYSTTAAGTLGVHGVHADDGTTVTVMTRNLYFGTDLTPVINAPDLPSLFSAIASAFNEAQASDFFGRANAWADEIAITRPDLSV